MENKKNLRLTRQTPAIARDSKEENETGAAALEAVTHRDGAAAQPVSSRCGTGTGASRAGERGLPLPSHGRLDWRRAQPEYRQTLKGRPSSRRRCVPCPSRTVLGLGAEVSHTPFRDTAWAPLSTQGQLHKLRLYRRLWRVTVTKLLFTPQTS